MESLSAYVRQFLQPFSKPDVDESVVCRPRWPSNSGSHVGWQIHVATVTEVYHYLRLLYAKIGVQHCPSCDLRITSQTAEQILAHVMGTYDGEQVTFLACNAWPQGLS